MPIRKLQSVTHVLVEDGEVIYIKKIVFLHRIGHLKSANAKELHLSFMKHTCA